MNLYKKKFPNRAFEDRVVDILRLSPQEWSNFQNTARHFLGKIDFHDNLPEHPRKKVLPSSLQIIDNVDSSNTLAALMHVEHAAHKDPNRDFHKGGGLYETGTSILSSLWNLIGLGPEFDSLWETLGWSKPKNRETPLDRYYAAIVDESYKKVEKRRDNVGHWLRLPRFDNKKISAWLDRDEKRVHVAVKGTSDASDVVSDLHILTNNTSGHEKEVRDMLIDVVTRYGNNYTYDVSGHSLGALEVMNVLGEDNPLLNKYERASLFNPGLTPTHALSRAKEAVKDDRFHFFLNSGDILSNGFVTLLGEESNVAWADPSHSLTGNHGLAQWKGDV